MRFHSRLVLFVYLTMFACNGTVFAKEPPIDLKDIRQARRWLRGLGGGDGEMIARNTEYLLRMGERAFPAYEAVLSDPKAPPHDVAISFAVLGEVEADRRLFLKYVVSHLKDEDQRVRRNGLHLLGEIGSAADASPVVALLSDEREDIPCIAASTLADIGGPSELVAMDVWLRGVSYRDNADIREGVRYHRDELKKRLEEDKDSRKRAQKVQKCWRELRVTEYLYPGINRAVWILTAFGAETVAFLKDRVRPVPVDTQQHLDQLLADLDSDSFDRREAATRELSRGVVAESVLEKALANRPSLEMRRRLEAILEDFPDWRTKNPELLRSVRAIWVLQQIGTPEARALLEKLAAGAPSALQTQKAKDALQSLDRLKKR
jgi:HEAT repeat protein